MNNIKMLPALLAFAEIAKQGSFTLAAQQLGMSKSAVSQQIKRLELDLGQQLLSRNTRGMSLTATGETLLQRCELLKDQLDAALTALDQTKEEPSGIFTLTIPHAVEKTVIVPALNQLCLEFPKIEPHIHVTDKALDLIQHNLDVSIYGGELKDSSYRALPLGTAGEVFCASRSYINQHGQPNNAEDLADHRFIATAWQKDSTKLHLDGDHEFEQSIKINHYAKTNTLPSALEMVKAGMGIALVPEFTIQERTVDQSIIRVLGNYRGKQWPFYFVHRFHGDKPVHITRFYQLVKHYFEKVVNSTQKKPDL